MRLARCLGATVLVAATLVAATSASAGADDGAKARRVLVFSIPHVSWADLDAYDLPNLRRVIDASGIAALTTRADQRSTRLGDGYLTLAAGTRAVGDSATDGDNFEVHERFGNGTAGDAFRQRTGRTVDRGIVSLGGPRVVETNDSLLYDAEIGAMPKALADAGIHRAAIGNGDGTQPDTPPSPTSSTHRRQVALGLMGPLGRVPAGTVDDSLLERDPASPYGVRLDLGAVDSAFERVWRDRSVVMVEASDLVRADTYRTWASPVHRMFLLRDALKRTDELFGRLLKHVDLHRDAIVIVGPAHSSRTVTLTPLAVHAPGQSAGLLRSATTRRDGFVQLIDVGPTILDLVGVDRPTSMEGRAVEVGGDGGSAQDRIDMLTREDAAAQFRDKRVFPAHWDPKLRIPRGQVVAAASIVSPKY